MRFAARVDENQAEIVEALRAAGATVYILKLPVDLLVGYRGKTALFEIKRPKGGRYTELQTKFMGSWTGGTVATVRDVEGALRVLKLLEAA